MKRVYVAGPFSADNVLDVLKNIGRGEKACASLFMKGFAPYCPWHDKTFAMENYDQVLTPAQFYEHGLAWLEVSDAVLVIGDWRKSKGTLAEIARAEELNIPIFGSEDALIAWAERD